MTSTIIFDAGALIAIERRRRRMQALLEEIGRRDWQAAVPAGALLRRGAAPHPARAVKAPSDTARLHAKR